MEQINAKGYGATGSFFSSLSKIEFKRNAPKDDEVVIDILYCGVCHSDLHQVKNDWGNTIYPCVPGHEIVGKVTARGAAVTKYNIGDTVGVGCMIDSCGVCHSCTEGLEQYCEGPKAWTATYNGPMKPDGTNTYGGYSNVIVVKESFVLNIPAALDVQAAAPILCAGVTTYSPLRHWGVKEGDKVGIAGIGGLGHMAVKLAKAMGAHVTAITTTKEKADDILKIGADDVLLSDDTEAMKKHELAFDFILNTIPDPYDVNTYVSLLKRDGAMVAVGVLAPFKKGTNNMEVAMHRRTVAGSLIGGIAETQEVLDFCAQHGIQPDIELIPIQDINKAYDRMMDRDIRFRFVIDMQSLKEEE